MTATFFVSGQNNLAALQQQQQLQQQLQQQVLALSSSPFGDSPLFRNLTVSFVAVFAYIWRLSMYALCI